MKRWGWILTLLATSCAAATPTPIVPQMAEAYKICDEGCTVTMPVGTVYQFGKGSTWLPPVTTVDTKPVYAYYTTFAADPIYGVVKEIDVRQTYAPQTVTYTVAGSTTPVTVVVPALPTPLLMMKIPPDAAAMSCWSGTVAGVDVAGNPHQYVVSVCQLPEPSPTAGSIPTNVPAQ